MPNIVVSESYVADDVYGEIRSNLGYMYPSELDLTPNSELHNKLKARILDRARMAYNAMSSRHDSWKQIDRTLTAYISTDAAERIVKRSDPRKPTSIVFPYSYAILETLTSYLDAYFLDTPIFKFRGNSPEDTLGAVMLEKIIDLHCTRNKASLALHTAFRDGLAYGIGATFPMWKQHFGFRTRTQEFGGETVTMREPTLLFEGNAIDNVDPYKLLLDPTFGISNIQESEFVGFMKTTNYISLLSAEESSGGALFNVKYLRNHLGQGSSIGQRVSGERTQTNKYTNATGVTNPVDLIFMYITIVPKQWKLGPSESPEKWLFCLANDSVIIQCQPLNADHNMFPIAICAPTFDGYSTSPLSRLEIMGGLQGLVDWLFNSHITNVRKAINDMIVVDPHVINMDDLANPEPGKLIRARRAFWGKPLAGSIFQLPVNDVTRSHINDTQIVASLMHKLSGTDDAMMGFLRQGGPDRLTGQEFQGTQNSAKGRLDAITNIISSQMMQDLGYMMAMHTQQLMEKPLYVDTVGRWSEVLGTQYSGAIQAGMMKVTPRDIQIDFDVSLESYTKSTQQDVATWTNLFNYVISQPELNQLFDVGKIFKHIALQLGAKNVDDFLRQPNYQPTEQVLQQADAGNMVPIQEVADALGG